MRLAPACRKEKIPAWVFDAIEDTTPERTFAITGGLGSGKTTGASHFFLARWLLNRNSYASWAVAPTATRCEQIILPALRQVLHDTYGMQDGVHYRILGGKFYKLVMKGYKHEIHILTGERPDRLVGANIAGFWITEPGLMERTVYEKLQARLRCPKAVLRQSILEGTPEGVSGKGAWYAEFDIPGVGYDRLDEKRNIRRFIVETGMNKYLTPSPAVYVQKLRQVYAYDPAKLLSYEKGLFVPFTKSTAYWEWVESRNVTSGVEPTPHSPVLLTFDFNVSPLAVVALQERVSQRFYDSPREKKLIALWESSGESRGLMDGVAEFSSAFPPHQYGDTPIHVYGDASGWARNLHSASSSYTEIDKYLRALGYRNVNLLAFRQNPSIRDRLEKTAALMAYERFLVDSRCRRLIESFSKTTLVEGTYEIDKPKDDKHSHWSDSCTYALFQVAKDVDVARPSTRRAYGV